MELIGCLCCKWNWRLCDEKRLVGAFSCSQWKYSAFFYGKIMLESIDNLACRVWRRRRVCVCIFRIYTIFRSYMQFFPHFFLRCSQCIYMCSGWSIVWPIRCERREIHALPITHVLLGWEIYLVFLFFWKIWFFDANGISSYFLYNEYVCWNVCEIGLIYIG